MPIALHLFTYIAVVVAVVAVLYKIYKYSTMPIHLRWELYPVPKEGEKVHHGGSFYEDLDWWKKDRKESLISEAIHMVQEMIFIKILWENKRSLWYRSFPFHFGLYMLIGTAGLLIFGVLLGVAGITNATLLSLLAGLIKLVGVIGLALATLGAAALLHRRLTDPDLVDFTAPRDIFNLVIFLATFACAWVAFVIKEGGLAALSGYMYSLITFQVSAEVGGFWVVLTLALFSFLILYVPISHMSHFVTKYFMWHKVRWDDTPNMVGSDIEKRIQSAVAYRVTWSAAHLAADGKKNWVDIATEDMPQK